MKVLFLAKLIQDRVLTPYGMYVLSASCRQAGHETDIVDAISLNHVRRAIERSKPDVLAFSTNTARWPFFREIARELKQLYGLPQLFGGSHPTFEPDIVKEPFIDGVCRCEADGALPEILDYMESGADYSGLRNWCFEDGNGNVVCNPLRPIVRDLGSLPMPHFELTDGINYCRNSPLVIIQATRGCMFNCAFCSHSGYTRLYAAEGKAYYRKSPVKRVIEEVKYVKEKFPCEFISFFDDHLIAGDDWTDEFAEEYLKAGGPPFSCHAVIPFINRKHAEKLARAGLKWIGMSLETANPELRRNVLNRHYTNEMFFEAVSILKEAGIKTYIGNILAYPGSTLESDIETLRMNRAARVDFADASIFIPFPGTRLEERTVEENLIDKKEIDRFHSQDPSFHRPVICDVGHKKYVRRLHCLFELAGDSGWVERNIETLVKLPLLPLYLLISKFHNIMKKRFVLFKGIHLPLKTQLALVIYNIFPT